MTALAGQTATKRRNPILSVTDLAVEFGSGQRAVRAVDGVSFDVYPGETLGIVGESGSGKSVSTLSMLGLVPQPPARVVSGQVRLAGRDLLTVGRRELRRVRGRDMAVVFQDPMSSLNPVLPIGAQVTEALRLHQKLSRSEARAKAKSLLADVGVPDPDASFHRFPHQYSGGMRQRVLIAMAMANSPKVIIADEPTTALDVTVQAQVLRLLRKAQQETDAAVLLITHDLGLIAEMADRVLVMYAGRLVEVACVSDLFHRPRHPYTAGLLAGRPRLDRATQELRPIAGQPPNLAALPDGCAFRPRCITHRGRDRCLTRPPLYEITGASERRSACHFHEELATTAGASAEGSE